MRRDPATDEFEANVAAEVSGESVPDARVDATAVAGADAGADAGAGTELDDSTIAVKLSAPVDESTVAVRLPAPVDDATIVVSQRSAMPQRAATPQGAATPQPAATPQLDATPQPAAAAHGSTDRQATSAHAEAEPARAGGSQVGAPVEEPKEIPPELAKLLFKNPLDTKRRAPAAPFPSEHASLPRGGVRSGIPVVYGARDEGFAKNSYPADLGRGLGYPPAGYALPIAAREGLPSLARLNRRFSALAWTGALVVPVVAGVGLWWVLTLLLQP